MTNSAPNPASVHDEHAVLRRSAEALRAVSRYLRGNGEPCLVQVEEAMRQTEAQVKDLDNQPELSKIDELRSKIFRSLRHHNVPDDCFAEIAAITQAFKPRGNDPHLATKEPTHGVR